VDWLETPQFGVVRRLPSRRHWQSQWAAHTRAPLSPTPDRLQPVPLPWREPAMPSAVQLGLQDADPPQRQRGGRAEALAVLHEFLALRSAQYRGGISSPLRAPTACSRLSPYLALGCLSLREVVQATQWHIAQLPPEAARQRQGLSAFMSRLVWHCHFIQKLEDEPELEWRNLHRGYDDLRDEAANLHHLHALMQGRTGWPMVDACVTMLRETGWLNFRMRAMLVSVAAYPLWLHWRPVGEWLARQFIDYEPGIHWSQLQMQSGTTGINTTRVYNPIKQAQDQDPHGHFVRRWLPALQRVPDTWLFQPWLMPPELQARCGVVVGVDIAAPLVDLEQATRAAKERVYALRTDPAVAAVQASIVKRHGSRNRRAENLSKPRKLESFAQASLDF
jgi:deoxyribodipyrimidine photo-lyase